MKVEVDVLGSQSLTVRTVSVDVKQHWRRKLVRTNSKNPLNRSDTGEYSVVFRNGDRRDCDRPSRWTVVVDLATSR